MGTEVSLIAEIRPWIPFASLGGQVIFGWFLYVLGKKFVSKGSCEKCRKDITDAIAKLSTDLGALKNDVTEDVKGLREEVSDDVKELRGDVDDLNDRVALNEERLSNQPTQEQFNQLNISMEKLSGGMDVLTERIDGVKEYQASLKELVLRVEDFVKEASKE